MNMIENKIDDYLNEAVKDGFIDTRVFAAYRREYLNTIKKAVSQLEKDVTLFVTKNKVGPGNPDVPDEIKQKVQDDIYDYFGHVVDEDVYENIVKLVDV